MKQSEAYKRVKQDYVDSINNSGLSDERKKALRDAFWYYREPITQELYTDYLMELLKWNAEITKLDFKNIDALGILAEQVNEFRNVVEMHRGHGPGSSGKLEFLLDMHRIIQYKITKKLTKFLKHDPA